MEVTIQEIGSVSIPGVRVQRYPAQNEYIESYFKWTPYGLDARFASEETILGYLKGWHHAPVFHEVELHADNEVFCFVHGTCIMPFCDIADGKPVMETMQLVRIEPGTQIIVAAGKGHFVPVAEGDFFEAVVYAPAQQAPRVPLPETVCGK